MRQRDPAVTAAGGIAGVAALFVGGGFVLDLAGALDATGWVVVVLMLAATALVAVRAPAWWGAPVLIALAALGLAAGAIALSRAGALDLERETRFTQLWLVPSGDGRAAEIGIRNEEDRATTFRVVVYAPESRGGPPLLEQLVVLAAGRSWSRRLAIPPAPLPERVDVELFRAGEAEPHRSAHVWTPPGI